MNEQPSKYKMTEMYEASYDDENQWTDTSDDWNDQDSWSDQDSWHLDKESDKKPTTYNKNQKLITDYFKITPKNSQKKKILLQNYPKKTPEKNTLRF